MDEIRILLIGNADNFHIEQLAIALKKYSPKPLVIDLMCSAPLTKEKLEKLQGVFDTVYWQQESSILKKLQNAGALYTLVHILNQIKLSASIKKRYTVAEIHYLSPWYAYMVPFIRRKTDNIFACLWGSDYYHERLLNKRRKKEFDYLLRYVDRILVGTSQMSSEIATEYPVFNNKVSEIRFGSHVIDRMKLFLQTANALEIKRRLEIDPDCIVISAGHNASREQSHVRIIDALEQVIKERPGIKIHVLFPMTYPADNGYRNEVKQRLQQVSFPFTIFEKFMPEEQVMEIRMISDMFVHIQSHDAFSAAMLEYFYAGTVVINGSWLKYPELDAAGMRYLSVKENTVTDLVNTLQDSLPEIQMLKKESEANRNIAYNLKSWEANAHKWLRVYDHINATRQ